MHNSSESFYTYVVYTKYIVISFLISLQTSAKNCDNVDRLFTEIAHELLQQVRPFTKFHNNHNNLSDFQAKAKDLPSESHSVQNISESSIGQSSSVKSNCCGKSVQCSITLSSVSILPVSLNMFCFHVDKFQSFLKLLVI